MLVLGRRDRPARKRFPGHLAGLRWQWLSRSWHFQRNLHLSQNLSLPQSGAGEKVEHGCEAEEICPPTRLLTRLAPLWRYPRGIVVQFLGARRTIPLFLCCSVVCAQYGPRFSAVDRTIAAWWRTTPRQWPRSRPQSPVRAADPL